MKLLVIEDDPLMRAALVETMANARDGDFDPTGVGTLAEGVELLKRNGYRAVLMDLGLPDSEGLATVMAVKAAAGDTAIVIHTAEQDVGLAVEAVKVGAHDYVVKPADEALIVRSIMLSVARVDLERAAARDATYRARVFGHLTNMESLIAEMKEFGRL